jgi:hypothetical protein
MVNQLPPFFSKPELLEIQRSSFQAIAGKMLSTCREGGRVGRAADLT